LVKTASNGGKCKDRFCMHMMVMSGFGWVLTQKTGEDNDKDARWKRVEEGWQRKRKPESRGNTI